MINDFRNNTDKYGLVQPGIQSYNGLFYTSEALTIQPDNMKLFGAITKCELKPGAFYRNPDKQGGHQSFDDLIGVAFTSKERAKRIRSYLRKRLGFYYILPNPNKFFSLNWFRYWGQIWLWRNPAFTGYLNICCGDLPGPIEAAALRVAIGSGADDQDGWRKTYFYVRKCREMNLFQNDCDEWSLILRIDYPKGIGEVRGEQMNFPFHPLSTLAWGDFAE